MAAAVERAVSQRDILICEAGTGTGKTLAYLVPAVAGGGRIVVSTGTRHLQEKLFERDLPLVCRALGRNPRIALLKGRSNYLCRWRYEQVLASGGLVPSGVAARAAGLSGWAARTSSGDLAEVDDLAENDPVRRAVTSTADNCLGSKCPMFDGCHVAEARRRATEADVVVVNHHLLFADMALKEQGFAELLPLADTLVIDEAHQIPDVTTRFFGVELTSGQLTELARDAGAAMQADAPDTPDLDRLAAGLEAAVREAADAFAPAAQRVEWAAMRCEARERIDAMETRLGALAGALDAVSVRGTGHRSGVGAGARARPPAGPDRQRAARARLRAMGGTTHTRVRRAPRAARHRPDPGRACRRGGSGLDPDLGHALRRGKPRPLRGPGGHGRCIASHLRRVVRLPEADPLLPTFRPAGAFPSGIPRGGRGGGGVGAHREPRARLPAVHEPSGASGGARGARRPGALAAVHAGGASAWRAARSFRRDAGFGPAGDPQLLGRRGHQGRRALAGAHRQAALRPPRTIP